eukprot:1367001-Rhodomonas_salina.2
MTTNAFDDGASIQAPASLNGRRVRDVEQHSISSHGTQRMARARRFLCAPPGRHADLGVCRRVPPLPLVRCQRLALTFAVGEV